VKSYGVLGRSNKEKKADPPDEAPGEPKIPFVNFRDEVKKGQNPSKSYCSWGRWRTWNVRFMKFDRQKLELQPFPKKSRIITV
jgi:hypothetical protein